MYRTIKYHNSSIKSGFIIGREKNKQDKDIKNAIKLIAKAQEKAEAEEL